MDVESAADALAAGSSAALVSETAGGRIAFGFAAETTEVAGVAADGLGSELLKAVVVAAEFSAEEDVADVGADVEVAGE